MTDKNFSPDEPVMIVGGSAGLDISAALANERRLLLAENKRLRAALDAKPSDDQGAFSKARLKRLVTLVFGEGYELVPPSGEAKPVEPVTAEKLRLNECNWTCARANICHEFEDCDGKSHFIPRAAPLSDNQQGERRANTLVETAMSFRISHLESEVAAKDKRIAELGAELYTERGYSESLEGELNILRPRVAALTAENEKLRQAAAGARQVLWRYRHETPVSTQPYMIAHVADNAIEAIDAAKDGEGPR